jgi:uncharacterized protein (TIGR00369 family)
MEHPASRQQLVVPQGNNRCFGCGPANSNGLRLEFRIAEDKTAVCQMAIPETFESFSGYLHGGIIATMLDEAMSKAVRTLGIMALTAQMEIDYLRPVPSGKPFRLEGRLLHSEGRKHWAEAIITNGKGSTMAKSKGLFVQVHSR